MSSLVNSLRLALHCKKPLFMACRISWAAIAVLLFRCPADEIDQVTNNASLTFDLDPTATGDLDKDVSLTLRTVGPTNSQRLQNVISDYLNISPDDVVVYRISRTDASAAICGSNDIADLVNDVNNQCLENPSDFEGTILSNAFVTGVAWDMGCEAAVNVPNLPSIAPSPEYYVETPVSPTSDVASKFVLELGAASSIAPFWPLVAAFALIPLFYL